MDIKKLKNKKLPDSPGVYFFMGARRKILYIGKATSLQDRVKSYFAQDVIATRGAHIVDMVFRATDIDFIKTDSVLEALILEANLIKRHQPYYNTKEKDDKSFNYIVITKEDFPRVLTVRGKDLLENFPEKDIRYVFGPYPNGTLLREGMKIIRKIFPFRDKCLPTEGIFDRGHLRRRCPLWTVDSAMPCFNRQIGLCPGVCTGEISKKDYAVIINHVKLFFEGKKNTLLRKLENEMKYHAKLQEFEKAHEIKKTIFALTHIQDLSLIKAEESSPDSVIKTKEGIIPVPQSLFRIEAYDVAHTSGQNVVGVMVVFEDHHIKKSDYRLFKIKRTKGTNDTAGLREILDRRLNHAEWQFPNLIVVDGNEVQKKVAETILKERGFDISVIAVVKNERHKPDHVLGDEKLREKYKKEILLVNSEAHRFAIKYHRKLRGQFRS
jgi:excinuclease ABC subunit C